MDGIDGMVAQAHWFRIDELPEGMQSIITRAGAADARPAVETGVGAPILVPSEPALRRTGA